MSSDLSIPPLRASPAEPARARSPRDAGNDVGWAPEAAAVKQLPNPTLRLDPGLGIVVIEFRDEAGAVRNSIPTEQQLQAYRTWERGHTEPAVKGSATEAD